MINGDKLKPYHFKRLDAPLLKEKTNETDVQVLKLPGPLQPAEVIKLPNAVNVPTEQPTINLPNATTVTAPGGSVLSPKVALPTASKAVPSNKTITLTNIDTRSAHGEETCEIKLKYNDVIYSASEFVEQQPPASTKTKRIALIKRSCLGFTNSNNYSIKYKWSSNISHALSN